MDDVLKELIKGKDDEIKKLNREVGRLQHQLEAFTEEIKIAQS